MQLERLELRNFRLVGEADIPLAPGANLFLGENAQGKTTLLEAVALLAEGRSFRTTRDRDLLSAQAVGGLTTVEARFSARGGRHHLRAALQPEGKVIYLDGKQVRRLGDLWGILNVVVFNPGDLSLILGPPAGRRGLLDGILAMSSRADLAVMQDYQRALRHRNALLREARRAPDAQFAVHEEQLALHGARLMLARHRLVGELAPLVSNQLAELAGGRDELQVVHESGWPKAAEINGLLEGDDGDALRGRLVDLWEKGREADWERCYTRNGPHRADIGLVIDGRDARGFASQGQARSIVLALRLAELDLLEARCGEPPVLLLDDVLGELDRRRTSHFVRLLSRKGVQSLLTATDAAWLESELPIAARFEVHGGRVSPR